MKRVYSWEPWFFIFFGLFHLHRIWALVDRGSYASFWLGVQRNKGVIYFLLMGFLSVLCVLGIITFIRERKNNYWWRWIYICGGSYLLFDLFAILTGLTAWQKLLDRMFDTQTAYWNLVWGFFIILGGFVFVLGSTLLIKTQKEKNAQ